MREMREFYRYNDFNGYVVFRIFLLNGYVIYTVVTDFSILTRTAPKCE